MLRKLLTWWCGLRYGHTFIMEHDDSRQWLRCVSCWEETPGWDRTPNHALMRHLRFQSRLARERSGGR